jgi:hypothetical protein
MDGIAHLLRNNHIDVPCPLCNHDVPVDLHRPQQQCTNCRHTFDLDPGVLLQSLKTALRG